MSEVLLSTTDEATFFVVSTVLAAVSWNKIKLIISKWPNNERKCEYSNINGNTFYCIYK